jgi:diguanylate cyclase (GGDEF)-like protein
MDKANTISQEELLERVNRAQRELAVLYEVSNAMRTTLELNRVLYIILTGVTSHFGLGFNRAILFLVNPQERCLEPKIAIGPESGEDAQKIWDYVSRSNQHLEDLIHDEKVHNIYHSSLYLSIKEIKIPLNTEGNLLAQAYHRGTAMHISQDQIKQYSSDPLLQYFKTNELVIMPLKAKDKVNGIIIADNLYTRKPITENDLKIFTMLANQAGLAIENSRLYEMIIHRSQTDSITGLWNHGYFQNKLSEYLEKARNENFSLSLIIFDIDDFKKLNDTYGHQNGDVVLKEIGQILRETSRENDFPCRYGGEEFSLILPYTNRDLAYQISERIRERIANFDFPKFASPESLKVTVSLGVAVFPDDATNKEELINLADKAMYIAKFSGKNRTCLATKN